MQIPYDPDFDKAPRRQWDDVFVALGAPRAFWTGIVLSLLVAGTIGFFVLLINRQ